MHQWDSLCLKVLSVHTARKLWIVKDCLLHKHCTEHNCFKGLPTHCDTALAVRGRAKETEEMCCEYKLLSSLCDEINTEYKC